MLKAHPFFKLILLASLLVSHAAFGEKPQEPPAIVEIKVVPGSLRYATTRFDVHPSQAVELTLNNTCIMPHNCVLVQPGKADAIVTQAMGLADQGMAKNFVPDSKDVIIATKIINPGKSETLKFLAPTQTGEYPYLCTFPGHGTVMRGMMRVRPAGESLESPLSEVIQNVAIADALKESKITSYPLGKKDHPFVLRGFVPNLNLDPVVFANHSPASAALGYDPSKGKDAPDKLVQPIPGVPGGFAVSFGKDFAYAWDSTECRLLYAWTGGFLNMIPYWGTGTGGPRWGLTYVPLIEGTVVFKTAGALAFQTQPGIKPKFRGYRVLSGNPEFSYDLGELKVHEHIIPADPNTFMIHYRTENPPHALKLVFDPAIRAQISCDQGSWKDNTLEIPIDHADHFMLLVRFEPGEHFERFVPADKKVSEEP
jgi:azurin